MLYALHHYLPAIEREDLDEAAIYGIEKAYERPSAGRPGRGFLRCPVCGHNAARFLPFGLARRPRAQCPFCGSIERHRLIWLYLQRHTDFFRRRLRVLHAAPEPCFAARFRAVHGDRYVTLDAFNPHADVQADITVLPFADNRFDVILCSHVLEHVESDRLAMRELARVLKPTGWALILVPFDPRQPTREDADIVTPAQRMAAYGHPYHYRIYGDDLPARLEDAGLRAEILDSTRLISGHVRRKYRINRNFMLLCRKRRR